MFLWHIADKTLDLLKQDFPTERAFYHCRIWYVLLFSF